MLDAMDVRRIKFISYIFMLFVIIETFILPSNILEVIPILGIFMENMASIFPAIGYYREYSEFPQVAQVVYLIGIISTIIVAIYLFSFFKKKPELNNISKQKALLISFVTMSSIVVLIFLFPGKPNLQDTSIKHLVYHYKLAFSLINSVLFTTASFFIGYFMSYLNHIIDSSNNAKDK